jgi:hypothetical protein
VRKTAQHHYIEWNYMNKLYFVVENVTVMLNTTRTVRRDGVLEEQISTLTLRIPTENAAAISSLQLAVSRVHIEGQGAIVEVAVMDWQQLGLLRPT